MKQFVLFSIFLIGLTSYSQTIFHPGNSNTIAKVEAGKSYHYYDNGGPNESYRSGTNSLITIYPSKEGQYVSLTCNSFEINTDCRMYVFDGNHAGAPILGYSGDLRKGIKINSGDVFTASESNLSGAISIRFTNINLISPAQGWDFTVSSLSTPGSSGSKTTQDCSGAIKVCSDSAITTRSLGSGFQELPGPGYWNKILNYGRDGENQSNWYKFEVAQSGTIEFLIKPHKHTDFDWSLWGPYKAHECPAWTTDKPFRTSAGDGKNSTSGITGLSSLAVDFHEGSSGDGFVAPLQVQKGEHYVLMIDDWSVNNTTFDLTWSFLNGASLECAKDKDPPVIPVDELIEELTNEMEQKDSSNTIEELPSPGPKLEAEISTDQTFVTVSYPGAFEFKIENENKETVITGHAVNSDEVEITRLPPGSYRVSLIYKKIKQYTTFVKN
jgi:hypothetical protein